MREQAQLDLRVIGREKTPFLSRHEPTPDRAAEGAGKIYVVSTTGVPTRDARVRVKGTVTPGLNVGGRSYGTAIRARDLDTLQLGDDAASSVGVRVEQTRLVVILVVTTSEFHSIGQSSRRLRPARIMASAEGAVRTDVLDIRLLGPISAERAGETVFRIGRIEEGQRGCTVHGPDGSWSATHNA